MKTFKETVADKKAAKDNTTVPEIRKTYDALEAFKKRKEAEYRNEGKPVAESKMADLHADITSAAAKHFGFDEEETEIHNLSSDGKTAKVSHNGKTGQLSRTETGEWNPSSTNEEALAESPTKEKIKEYLKKAIAGGTQAKTPKEKAKAGKHLKFFAGKYAMQNEESENNTAYHRFLVTISDPHHPHVSKRDEKIQKTVRIKSDFKDAEDRAFKFYKKQGYRVHDVSHIESYDKQQEE